MKKIGNMLTPLIVFFPTLSLLVYNWNYFFSFLSVPLAHLQISYKKGVKFDIYETHFFYIFWKSLITWKLTHFSSYLTVCKLIYNLGILLCNYFVREYLQFVSVFGMCSYFLTNMRIYLLPHLLCHSSYQYIAILLFTSVDGPFGD